MSIDLELPRRRTFNRLLVAIIILNIIDLVVTMYPSFGYGPLIEANPILLRVYAIAPFLLIVYKVALGFILAGGLWLFGRYADFRVTYWCSVAIVIGFGLATIWNLLTIIGPIIGPHL